MAEGICGRILPPCNSAVPAKQALNSFTDETNRRKHGLLRE